MKKLFLFIALLLPHHLYSQTSVIDSIASELKQVQDQQKKVDLLNELGWAYFLVDTEKYGLHVQRAYEEAKRINYVEGEIVALSHLSWFYQQREQIDKAFEYGIQSVKLLDSAKITNIQTRAWVYLVVGAIYDIQGQYDVAFPYYEKSLTLYKEDNDLLRASWVLGNLGAAYSDQGDYTTSISYTHQYLSICDQLKNKTNATMGYQNIGDDYLILENYDSASFYLHKGLEAARESQETLLEKNILLSLAQLYLLQNKNEQAYQLLNQVNDFLKENYDISIALSYHSIATLYYEATNNYKEALFHERQQKIYTDSINDLDSQKDAARLQGNFEIERKVAQEKEEEEKRRKILEEKLERQNMLIYTGITIILIIIIGFLYLLKTFNASERVLKAGLFFVLLLLFEFVLLLLEPKIEMLAAGNILIKLVANLIIALPIVPLHSWLEKRLIIFFIGKESSKPNVE